MGKNMNIGIYIYDQVEVLDFSGPFEVFTTASRICEDDNPFTVFLIGRTGELIHARAGFCVMPDYCIDDHPDIDVLIVPGGVHTEEMKQPEVIQWLYLQSRKTDLTASVCTGAFLLAEAQILTDHNVTTHWQDIPDLRQKYPDLNVHESARWIDEGRIVTSAGISAGIDMSLHLISRFQGPGLAEKTARQMEFHRTKHDGQTIFDRLEKINARPVPFEFYSAEDLWTHPHTSKMMLEFHLNESVDLSSRNKDFIARSAAWIVSHFNVGSETHIADFGCGPGLYTTLFAENNAIVTGIDFSAGSIRYAAETAKRNGLKIDYYQQNYLEFETEKRFDLITMIFCDYCALSPSQRKILLEKFHSMLHPQGSLLLDVHSLNIFNSRSESALYEMNQLNGFWAPEKYYGFVNMFTYEEEKVTLDKYTIIEKDNTRVIHNWLQYFDRDSLQQELKDNGFDVKNFYSDVAGIPFSEDSPDMAVIAKKS